MNLGCNPHLTRECVSRNEFGFRYDQQIDAVIAHIVVLAVIKAAFPASFDFFRKKPPGSAAAQGSDNPGTRSAVIGKGRANPQFPFVNAALLMAAL